MQDAFAEFWKKVASSLKNHKNLVGYELINEPWMGDIYRHPDLLLNPASADRKHLAPLYEKLNQAIRSIDNDHLIFYEPIVIDYIRRQAGFDHVPGGAVYNNRSVYSYHIYCGLTDRNGEPTNDLICHLSEDYLFDLYIRDYQKIGGGGVLTEWGNMPENPIDIKTIDYMLDQADKFKVSWAWWQFKSFHDITTSGIGTSESFYDENGKLQQEKVAALSRTYAQAVAGKLYNSTFDRPSSRYHLEFQHKKSITQPTEIYLNKKWHYPLGYQIIISPNNAATWKEADINRIFVTVLSTIADGTLITVTITPQK